MDHSILEGLVRLALNHGRYTTRVARTITEATVALESWHPKLMVLDMDMAASAVLEQRKGSPTLPVVALTRRGDLKSKLAAFERGVDDIVTVPFSPEEFVARVLAVMRRSYGGALAFIPNLRFGDLEIDILNRRVTHHKIELHLTPVELSLLYLFAANAGRVLNRNEILDGVWGSDYVAESNVVDRHVRNLRVKLEDHIGARKYITTVPRRGYCFTSGTPVGGA